MTPCEMDLADHVVLSRSFLTNSSTVIKKKKLQNSETNYQRYNPSKLFRITQMQNCIMLLLNLKVKLYWKMERQKQSKFTTKIEETWSHMLLLNKSFGIYMSIIIFNFYYN